MSTPSTGTDRARQPKGIPVGGQFAASAHAESGVSLSGATAVADPGQFGSPFGSQDDLDETASALAYLEDGESLTFSGAFWRGVTVTCERRPAVNALGIETPGTTQGTYVVKTDDGKVERVDFNNLQGNEVTAVQRIAEKVDRYLAPPSHTAAVHPDLDTHPAILATIAHAKEQDRPIQINTNGLPGWAFDEGADSSSCGDVSLGAEPSVRATWATGRDDEPFITATTTHYVTGRRDGEDHDLDYDDWTEHVDRMKRADEADEQADAIYDGAEHLTDNDRHAANLDIDRLRRLAAGIREEEGTVRYAIESQTEWIAHTSLDDIGSSEVRSDVERNDGSAMSYLDFEQAQANARGATSRVDFGRDYAPQNWK